MMKRIIKYEHLACSQMNYLERSPEQLRLKIFVFLVKWFCQVNIWRPNWIVVFSSLFSLFFLCVCVCVVSVCPCVYMHACVYVCMPPCVCMYAYVCMCVCTLNCNGWVVSDLASTCTDTDSSARQFWESVSCVHSNMTRHDMTLTAQPNNSGTLCPVYTII